MSDETAVTRIAAVLSVHEYTYSNRRDRWECSCLNWHGDDGSGPWFIHATLALLTSGCCVGIPLEVKDAENARSTPLSNLWRRSNLTGEEREAAYAEDTASFNAKLAAIARRQAEGAGT